MNPMSPEDANRVRLKTGEILLVIDGKLNGWLPTEKDRLGSWNQYRPKRKDLQEAINQIITWLCMQSLPMPEDD